MKNQELFDLIRVSFNEFVHRSSDQGIRLRNEFDQLHPADRASFFTLLDLDDAKNLFLSLSTSERLEIFTELSDPRKAVFLTFLPDDQLHALLTELSVDELARFFDELSDDELKRYLKLLQEKEREYLISVLKLREDSAGRNMDINVLTLHKDFTVAQSIQILQRLQPDQELHRRIYVTAPNNILVGYILLEDLVLKKPETKLVSIARDPEFVVNVQEDQEAVAQNMIHYGVMNAPVVDKKKRFLGVIASDSLIDIIEEESSEDIFRMATMRPIKTSYFETSFSKLLFQRSSILIILLFAQIISTMILEYYEGLLVGFLSYFLTMLVSTGGNASSQTSALLIQGFATGEITNQTMNRFVVREFFMALMLGIVLGSVSFVRTYLWYHNLWGSVAVSCSLAAIVVISVTLGSCIPIFLRKMRLDPAHSAGPLLATIMDIVGLFTYCTICQWILS